MMSTVLTVSIALATTSIVAVIAYLVDGRGTPIRAFGRALLSLSVCLLGLQVLVVSNSPSLATAGARMAGLGLVFLPPQLLLLGMKFRSGTGQPPLAKRRALVVGSYAIALWFAYLTLAGRLVVPAAGARQGELLLLKAAAGYFVIYLMIVFLLLLVALESMFRSLRDHPYKGLRVLVAGGMVAFVFGIVSASQVFVTAAVTAEVIRVVSAAIAISTLLFAALMIRVRAIKDNIVISRQATYSSAMLFLVGGLLIAIGATAKLVENLGGDMRAFYSVFAAFTLLSLVAAIITSASIKERMKAFIDRSVFSGTYDYREIWSRFSDETAENLELRELVHRLLGFIRNLLSAEHAAILLLDRGSNQFILQEIVGRPRPEVKPRIHVSGDFADWLWRWGKPVTMHRLAERPETQSFLSKWGAGMDALDISVWVPLIARGEFVGIMGLGKLHRGRQYRVTDLELLEILGSHSAVAILNSRMKEELIVSKELESFYKVSSFVVHDLRNAVSRLSMTLANAEKHITDRSFQKDMLRTLARSVEAMRRTMSRLSALGDGLALKRMPVDVDQLVRDVIAEVGLCNQDQVSVRTDLRAGGLLFLDRDQIQRLLSNLIVNALEAMPSGGKLQVRTELLDLDSLHQDGQKPVLKIEVQDSGAGIAPEFMDQKLFKPFETTKKRGLGLGLYQCREIARAHGGEIAVHSKPGQGSRFVVTLPAEPAKVLTSEKVAVV